MTDLLPNLLIIYEDAPIHLEDILKLNKSFQIKIIKKTKGVSFINFRKEGNILISRYHRIFFSTNSKNVLFICASELKDAMLTLFNFKNNADFGFFKRPTNKLVKFLSGFFVKKEVLIRIGCLDKYTFYNTYLNFLINYLRFYHILPEETMLKPLIGAFADSIKYNFLNLFEDSYYRTQVLYSDSYQIIRNKVRFYPSTTAFVSQIIDKFVRRNTSRWYW